MIALMSAFALFKTESYHGANFVIARGKWFTVVATHNDGGDDKIGIKATIGFQCYADVTVSAYAGVVDITTVSLFWKWRYWMTVIGYEN